jgi:hypothetical protein
LSITLKSIESSRTYKEGIVTAKHFFIKPFKLYNFDIKLIMKTNHLSILLFLLIAAAHCSITQASSDIKGKEVEQSSQWGDIIKYFQWLMNEVFYKKRGLDGFYDKFSYGF